MIWLIGCKGMLGSEVAKQLGKQGLDFVGSDKEVDITEYKALENFSKNNPGIKWIINCSAFTAVDAAETNKELAELLNVRGPENIGKCARKIGAKVIHISTDYVFDGRGSVPYTENMPLCPLGVYGDTKARGEIALEAQTESYYIIRTAWLYGFNGKNFVYTMIKAMENRDFVKVVCDQRGTPTSAVNLAGIILKIIMNGNVPFGIYHCTDLGETDWYNFALKIYELGKKYGKIQSDCEVLSCTTEEYPTPAKRPAYSVLSKEKIKKALNIKLKPWEESLEDFISSEFFNLV